MIRLGGKFENVLVSQVKVLHHWQTATPCGSIRCTHIPHPPSELFKPYDARLMRCYLVSTRINHVANDDEECSAPVELAQIRNRLFM